MIGKARQIDTGEWVKVDIADGKIAAVEDAEGPDEIRDDDPWVAPAFWDIQTNGRWGISFSAPDLTVDQVVEVVRAQAHLGTARLCPTLITAMPDATIHGVRTIAQACDAHPDVASMILGIHLEGPYLSEIDGYRGAHPIAAIRDPDRGEFEAIQAASGGRVVMMTLAPERPGSLPFIEWLVARGVAVAVGHTAADGATLRAAAASGARLSTHLGNGIASPLPRHPNPIWDQAALDELWASVIADGHHLEPCVLKTLVRAKTPERVILVSDASPLAGLPPGRHGEWEVVPEGKVVVAGTPYLAGAMQGMAEGTDALIRVAGLTPAQAIAAGTKHPARFLGRPDPAIEPGQPANLIRFRLGGRPAFELTEACVDGRWVKADDAPARE
ncbi:N-acetylglucosamine-6-phosphate deacetylase [Tundrisphaera sp. TA3]|uniref:N-acetylglucosamine-6-phosphate deacetylase n=1 Tax=Tundrisphaera sp. TA3 TaxID=3435775 RepID=UPI003EBBA4F6